MAKLETVLKEEIRRLARKEVPATVGRTVDTVSAQKREISALKRQVENLEKRLNRQVKAVAKGVPAATVAAVAGPESEGQAGRFSPKGLRTHRKKLGLSAADYGRLAGLSGLTIYNYENGKSRPRRASMAALMAVRQMGKREATRRLAELDGGQGQE